MREIIKSLLKIKQRNDLKFLLDQIISFNFRDNLTQLGYYFNTDKVGSHFYTTHYQNHFKKLRKKRIKMFEIGVGGYESSINGGNSLRMWKRYFPFAKIVSLDLYDKSPLEQSRIKIYQGSQTDPLILDKIIEENGEFDIIIDDGSHINEHVIFTFNHLFPKMKNPGIYVIEDVQTSYWDDFGGSSKNLKENNTIMNYFKHLTDSINSQEIVNEEYKENYFDKNIVSMHFYHNMIFIYKGKNDELSNFVRNHRRIDL